MWEFNYGEWTEAYVFLSLLGTGRIYAADENFERSENVYIDILKIIRYEGMTNPCVENAFNNFILLLFLFR